MMTPWDIPPWPKLGDSMEGTLFEAIGRFLTEWEITETTFAELFACIVATEGPREIAARSFGTIVTSRGRAEMLLSAAEAHSHVYKNSDLIDEIKELLKPYQGIGARRNEIAHGRVTTYAYLRYALGEDVAGPERPGFCLIPSEYMTNKNSILGKPKYVYNSEIIASFAAPLLELGARARGVMKYLHGIHGTPWPKPDTSCE